MIFMSWLVQLCDWLLLYSPLRSKKLALIFLLRQPRPQGFSSRNWERGFDCVSRSLYEHKITSPMSTHPGWTHATLPVNGERCLTPARAAAKKTNPSWPYSWLISHIHFFPECPIRTLSAGVDRGGLGHCYGSRSPVCIVLEEVPESLVHGTVPWLQTGSNCHRGQRNQSRNQEWSCWGSQGNIEQRRNRRERLVLFSMGPLFWRWTRGLVTILCELFRNWLI